jgi:hypothetical protein
VFIIFNKPAGEISENGLLDHSSTPGGCPLNRRALWPQKGRSGPDDLPGLCAGRYSPPALPPCGASKDPKQPNLMTSLPQAPCAPPAAAPMRDLGDATTMATQPTSTLPPPTARHRALSAATTMAMQPTARHRALSAAATMATQSSALSSRPARQRAPCNPTADHLLAVGAAPMRVASV